MVLYLEDPQNSIEGLLDIINKFSKVAGYKVNTQKSIAFLYPNDKIMEREIRESTPSHYHPKK